MKRAFKKLGLNLLLFILYLFELVFKPGVLFLSLLLGHLPIKAEVLENFFEGPLYDLEISLGMGIDKLKKLKSKVK